MLKRKIAKDAYDSLPDAVKALYKEVGDHYVLEMEEGDLSGLRKKVDELLDEKKKAQQRAKEAEEEAARKSGNIGAIEESWKAKLEESNGNWSSQLEAAKSTIRSLTIDATASKLASELAIQGSAKALLPHIASRLDLEMNGNVPTIRVLDANGKPTAMTIEELSKEIASDAALSPIIAASRASGGGASGGSRSGGSQKQLKDMTEAERVDFHKRDPVGFKAALANK